VGQKNVADRVYILERKIADAGTGIYQDIIVDQHGRRTRSRADATTAT